MLVCARLMQNKNQTIHPQWMNEVTLHYIHTFSTVYNVYNSVYSHTHRRLAAKCINALHFGIRYILCLRSYYKITRENYGCVTQCTFRMCAHCTIALIPVTWKPLNIYIEVHNSTQLWRVTVLTVAQMNEPKSPLIYCICF